MDSLGRVLIIDDEAVLRQTLMRILQKAGCETITAAEGQTALRLISENLFDLIFLDIHIPDIDGLQILKEVRQRNPKLPVVILTGYGSMQSAVEALRLGATDYLMKPFDPEVLVSRARMILREQTIERRRKEIRAQISALQSELEAIDNELHVIAPPAESASKTEDRFFTRGPLILDLQTQRASINEEVLSLPPSTYKYLLVLAQHSPDVVDYQTLVTEAHGYQVNAVEAGELAKWHIHSIRQSLNADPLRSCQILNARGVGYRLIVD